MGTRRANCLLLSNGQKVEVGAFPDAVVSIVLTASSRSRHSQTVPIRHAVGYGQC